MFSLRVLFFSIFWGAQLSYCIEFHPLLNASDTSNNSLTFTWTRVHGDPQSAPWMLASISGVNHSTSDGVGIDLEFQHIQGSQKLNGTVTIPVQHSVNLTLVAFLFNIQ
ncbi:hypothetical protein GYMLUDRAFT_924868 [Collybiopsis luxurians FD-317 M1]|uniref:Uncharacterized protein n=1 Tax=Collybiopsis luxurians FD-317 M1 TaxID=944289 RepID=A0A0D0CG13_9AGAR|nr:hypothetical protein GYMLUDRAFT_924868 [Collybiopsis luxurians FD-317 M1]